MKTLILFDSQFGNTKKIAEAIGDGFDKQHQVEVLSATKIVAADLKDVKLLIVGSPTQGGRAMQPLQVFLERLPERSLTGVEVAAFDTRFLEAKQNGALRLLMKTIGYAAPKLAKQLQRKGGNLIVQPRGFIVEGKEGPLAEGELKKAKKWAQKIEQLL